MTGSQQGLSQGAASKERGQVGWGGGTRRAHGTWGGAQSLAVFAQKKELVLEAMLEMSSQFSQRPV